MRDFANAVGTWDSHKGMIVLSHEDSHLQTLLNQGSSPKLLYSGLNLAHV